MFELKRSKLIEEQVKIGDEVLVTQLNLTKDASKLLEQLRKLEIIQVNLEKGNDLANNLKLLGESVIEITKMIFGTNFEKVLRFYSNDELEEIKVTSECVDEMIYELLPFVLYLKPQIDNFVKDKKKEMNKAIKGKRVD